MSTSATVVVSARNEGEELRSTVLSLTKSLDAAADVVVVDDGSTDRSADHARGLPGVRLVRSPSRLGVAGARNFGAAQASGDVLVFCDAHIRTSPGWLPALLAALGDARVGASGPCVCRMGDDRVRGYGLRFVDDATNVEWLPLRSRRPYPVPALGGFCLAVRRDVFEAVGRFDAGMRLYGMEDLEFSVRLWTFGYQCVLVPEVVVRHRFRDRGGQVDWPTGLHNVLRFGVLHLGPARLQALIEHYRGDPVFPAALAELLSSEVWAARDRARAGRRHDDVWFFTRVNR